MLGIVVRSNDETFISCLVDTISEPAFPSLICQMESMLDDIVAELVLEQH